MSKAAFEEYLLTGINRFAANPTKQMNQIKRSRQFALNFLLVSSFALSAVGCSNVSQVALERESSNIKLIAVVYGKFLRKNRGNPPATKEAFREFLKQNSKSFGAGSADEILVSERDNEPYKILCAKKLPQTSSKIYVACENTGVNGLRFAATALGSVEEVEADKLGNLLKAD